MTILWDWNGTLLSDVPLVVKVNNEVFSRHGYRLTSEEEYRRLFRFPVKEYYTEIGVSDEDFPVIAREWNAGYVANFHLARLHEGAAETVRRFHEAGFHQAIVSASQIDQLRAQVALFPELTGMFDDILGLDNVYAVSKVQLAKDYLARGHFRPEETVFLGDTDHDAEVARAIGCRCMLISGGHQCDEVLHQVKDAKIMPSLLAVAEELGA